MVEPRNPASDRLRVQLAAWGDRELVERDWETWFAETFVREDRRGFVSLPPVDRKQYREHHLAWFELDGAAPDFSIHEVHAVRGDRLALVTVRVRVGDSMETDMIAVARLDQEIARLERVVLFEPDDVDAGIAELDRMWAALSQVN